MPDLLTVETSRLRISWSGPAPSESAGTTHIRAFHGAATVEASGASGSADPAFDLPLAVPEEAVLTLLAQSLTGEPVEVVHRDPGQTSGLVSTRGGRAVHGPVRVRDEVGQSRFTFRVGGTPEAEIVLAVVPTKLSPADVRAMREDVEAAWTGAALAAWGATTDRAASGDPSRPAWLALLRYAVARLNGPLADIARRPETDLVRREHLVPASRLRGDASGLRAIRQGRGEGAFVEMAGASMRERVPVHVLRMTEDVTTHRWLRARLDRSLRTLARIQREESSHPYAEQGRRQALRDDLDAVSASLRSFTRQGPLAEASGARAPARPPLVLRRRPAYRQAFEALRLLDRGLAVASGEVETAWLGTARLYETWAALSVVRALAQVLGAEPPEDPFGAATYGASVRLGRGRRHAVVLRGASGEVEVAYEPRFGGPPALLSQRPDLLLTLRQPGHPPRRAVLDAKYRRDDSAAYAPPSRRGGAARGLRSATSTATATPSWGPTGIRWWSARRRCFPSTPGRSSRRAASGARTAPSASARFRWRRAAPTGWRRGCESGSDGARGRIPEARREYVRFGSYLCLMRLALLLLLLAASGAAAQTCRRGRGPPGVCRGRRRRRAGAADRRR